MKAFFSVRQGGLIVDTIVRAENKEKAAQYAGEGELHEVPDDVASAMGVPNTEGCHHGAVTSWMIGPTNLLGDLKRPV